MRVASLYLDLNSYFASVEQQLEPRLRGRPVAVLPSMTRATCCIAVSYEAKAFGVKTGTKVYEAEKRCPDLIFRPARHDAYVAYHDRVKAEIERHAPVEAVCSIDEFSCRLIGDEQPLDAALALALRIKAGMARNVGAAIRCSIGLAPNRLLAKIAGDLQKPDGLSWILPGEQHKLYELALDDLPGVAVGLKRRLVASRIYTVEQLVALEPRHARMIWGGVGGERFVRQLRGEDIPAPPTQRRCFGHSQMLAPVNRAPERARLIGRFLLVKAARRMRREAFSAGRLYAGARSASGRHYSRETSLAPSNADLDLLRVYERIWAGFAFAAHDPLKKVSVSLGGLTPDAQRNPDLFIDDEGGHAPRRGEALARAVDAVAARYGARALTYGPRPPELASYSGARIAFNRIPGAADFDEDGI